MTTRVKRSISSTPNSKPSVLQDSTPWFIRFQRMFDEFTEGEKRVGDYFREHPEAAQKSISEVIDVSGLGYGTVIRFSKKLGCRGFQEFKLLMARDAGRSKLEEAGEEIQSYTRVLDRLTQDIQRTAEHVDQEEIEKGAQAICDARRVLSIGVASSSPLALSLDWRLKRFGFVSSSLSDAYVMSVEASQLGKGGVLFAISSSGSTKDIVAAAELARKGGATVIALTNFTKAPLVETAHIRLITSAARDPWVAEIPSIVAGEVIFEILIDHIRRLRPEVDETVLKTFNAIADRKF